MYIALELTPLLLLRPVLGTGVADWLSLWWDDDLSCFDGPGPHVVRLATDLVWERERVHCNISLSLAPNVEPP